jgi:hypothetical protein
MRRQALQGSAVVFVALEDPTAACYRLNVDLTYLAGYEQAAEM